MARFTAMHRFARWHIWLGWLAAIPLLLWTVSGLELTLRPIDEVRGEIAAELNKRGLGQLFLGEGDLPLLARGGKRGGVFFDPHLGIAGAPAEGDRRRSDH